MPATSLSPSLSATPAAFILLFVFYSVMASSLTLLAACLSCEDSVVSSDIRSFITSRYGHPNQMLRTVSARSSTTSEMEGLCWSLCLMFYQDDNKLNILAFQIGVISKFVQTVKGFRDSFFHSVMHSCKIISSMLAAIRFNRRLSKVYFIHSMDLM